MDVIGTVVNTVKNVSTVEVERSSGCTSCSNCAQKGLCHAHLIFGQGGQTISVNIENHVNATIGDRVQIGSSTAKVLTIISVVFLVPIFLAIAMYLCLVSLNISDLTAVISTAIAFVLIFVFNTFFMNRYAKKRLTLRIIKIIEEGKD